jgi:hypothetical protein
VDFYRLKLSNFFPNRHAMKDRNARRNDPGAVGKKDPCFFSGGSWPGSGGDGGGAGSALGPCAPLWIVHGSIHADTRPPALRALYGHPSGTFQRLKLSPSIAGIMSQDVECCSFGITSIITEYERDSIAHLKRKN